jgi:hypothetical protein
VVHGRQSLPLPHDNDIASFDEAMSCCVVEFVEIRSPARRQRAYVVPEVIAPGHYA